MSGRTKKNKWFIIGEPTGGNVPNAYGKSAAELFFAKAALAEMAPPSTTQYVELERGVLAIFRKGIGGFAKFTDGELSSTSGRAIHVEAICPVTVEPEAALSIIAVAAGKFCPASQHIFYRERTGNLLKIANRVIPRSGGAAPA